MFSYPASLRQSLAPHPHLRVFLAYFGFEACVVRIQCLENFSVVLEAIECTLQTLYMHTHPRTDTQACAHTYAHTHIHTQLLHDFFKFMGGRREVEDHLENLAYLSLPLNVKTEYQCNLNSNIHISVE